jgi:hypothetical protein
MVVQEVSDDRIMLESIVLSTAKRPKPQKFARGPRTPPLASIRRFATTAKPDEDGGVWVREAGMTKRPPPERPRDCAGVAGFQIEPSIHVAAAPADRLQRKAYKVEGTRKF